MTEPVAPLSAEEISKYRELTPGYMHVSHFNNAGAALMSVGVLKTVTDHLKREAEIGGYEAADEASARLDGVYASIAKLINADVDEIAIVENATRAWDMAFYGIPLKPKDRILTSASEYASNVLAFLQVAKKGVSVEVIPNDATGQVDVAALAGMLDAKVKVVAISHMPTNGGLVQPAAEIGRILRAAKSKPIYILDACQTVGQMPVDVREIGCDVLSATSRKYLRGPRGVGFLYVRRAAIERITPPMIDLKAARWVAKDRYEIEETARRFENWESNIAGTLGMGKAIDEAMEIGIDRIWATVQARAQEMRSLLRTIPGLKIHDLGAVKGGIVTFTLEGYTPDEIKENLHGLLINVTTSTVASTRFDMESRNLDKVVRASVHYTTERGEIGHFVRAVVRMVADKQKEAAIALGQPIPTSLPQRDTIG